MLARAIDKMRAHLAGTPGGYIAHKGFRADVFELFGTDAAMFEEIVRTHDTDEGVLASLMAIKHPTAEAITAYNPEMTIYPSNAPADVEQMYARMAKAGFGHRTNVVTWFGSWDLKGGARCRSAGASRLATDRRFRALRWSGRCFDGRGGLVRCRALRPPSW
jgi:hypothetical protein